MNRGWERFLSSIESESLPAMPDEIADAVWLSAMGFVLPSESQFADDAERNDEAPPERNAESEPKGGSQGHRLPEDGVSEDHSGSERTPVFGGAGSTSSQAGWPLFLAGASGIARPLEYDRALRSWRSRRKDIRQQVFDEQASAMQLVESGIAKLVTRPQWNTRWERVSLVIERSPTMRLWQHAAAEFLSTLQRASGTQNVSCHFLEFFAGELTLTDTAGRLVSPRSLRVAQVPQVIVLVSDAMGFGWQTGLIPQWLRRWSDQCPTILVQPLPTHLWARTSLRRLVPRSLSRPASRLPTLVTELDPSALKGVAEFLSGRPQLGSGVTGIDNEPEDFCVLGPGSSFSKPQRPQEFSEQELDELYADFSARANPLTFRLALYLATLQLLPPIMRLTQAALVPGSAPWHLADLFLSGLIRRKERSSAVAREPKSLSEIDDIEYEFLPGIAERLRADGGIARQFEAIDLVSRLIESRTGRGSEFLAYVLADEDNDSAGIPAENLSSDERALAEVSRHHLRQLGGKGSQIGRGNARSIVITIDGPAGAGKTSIARQVAERLGFELLDTGALYRASALAAIRAGIDLENADALVSFVRGLDLQWRDRRVYLDGEEVTEEIRSPTVTSAIRFLANLPQIRDQISRHARRIAEGRKVVTEGKNQGSEIFPDAVCKVYLICSIEERARRRQRQLAQSGRQVSWEKILESQNRRDAENLAVSASMGPIPRDAVIVDTTGMSVDAVTERVLEIFEQRVGRQTSDIGEAVQVPRNPIAREQTDIPEDGNRRTRVASERAETRQVFISYVHEDEALKDQLATIMKAMPRLVVAERPSSNQDGEELRTLLRKTIERSQSAICLVSNHYLSSKFISDVELPLLLELQEKSALSLHWVPLTRCDVSVQPFLSTHNP